MKLRLRLLNLWDGLRFRFMSIEAIDRELAEDVERIVHDPRVPIELKRLLVEIQAERYAHEREAK